MAGLDLSQLKSLVIAPTMAQMASAIAALNSTWAINQVTGTALVESNTTYLEQIPDGPALGLFQMEPATHDDCWTNFIDYNANLKSVMQAIAGQLAPSASLMITNLAYAAAMCRVKYWRSPLAAPAYNDAIGLASYHKTVYNTAAGAASVAINTPLFEQAILA